MVDDARRSRLKSARVKSRTLLAVCGLRDQILASTLLRVDPSKSVVSFFSYTAHTHTSYCLHIKPLVIFTADAST
jgi:hypothetical protein